MNPLLLMALIVFVLFLFIGAMLIVMRVIPVFTQVYMCGVRMSPLRLLRWSLRPASVHRPMVFAMIRLRKADIDVPARNIEEHARLGGDCTGVVDELIAAKLAGSPLTFEEASRADLACRGAG